MVGVGFLPGAKCPWLTTATPSGSSRGISGSRPGHISGSCFSPSLISQDRPIILCKKIETIWKTNSSDRMLEWLRKSPGWLRPLAVSRMVWPREEAEGPAAVVVFAWKDQEFRFGVETSLISTPKGVAAAADRAKRECAGTGFQPMILVPYLPEPQLQALMDQEVSGLDLCGNGVLMMPGRLLFYRTGFPNTYPRSAGIKNIYRRESSVVARVFLLQPGFPSVGAVLEEISTRARAGHAGYGIQGLR